MSFTFNHVFSGSVTFELKNVTILSPSLEATLAAITDKLNEIIAQAATEKQEVQGKLDELQATLEQLKAELDSPETIALADEALEAVKNIFTPDTPPTT